MLFISIMWNVWDAKKTVHPEGNCCPFFFSLWKPHLSVWKTVWPLDCVKKKKIAKLFLHQQTEVEEDKHEPKKLFTETSLK